MKRPSGILQNFVPLAKHPGEEKRKLPDTSQENSLQPKEPLGLHLTSLRSSSNSIPTQSVTANCLLKHKAMDSEKHPDFFFSTFWWELGWGMGGVGADGDTPRQLCAPRQLSRASQVQSSSVTPRCVAINVCCGYRQSRFGLRRERMGI